MKRIEAIIRPARLPEVKEALANLGVGAITVSYAWGEALGEPQHFTYRCQNYKVDLLPKVKVEMLVGARFADEVIQAVIGAARTGEIDDGLVFVYEVAEAIRICDCQRDEAAV